MQIDLMDVRLDEQRRPYAVHETVTELKESEALANNPQNAVKLLNEIFHMKDFAEERVYLILMTTKLEVISFAEVSKGIINQAVVSMREIMQRMLLCNASRLIIAHNHPSGKAVPSGNDMKMTQELMTSCNMMGVELCDHIIIGGNEYYSFAKNMKMMGKGKEEWQEYEK